MLKWLIRNRLAAFEKKFGYDTSYMRELLDTDVGAFFAVAKTQKLGSYRKDIPIDVYYGAKIFTVMSEDCGPCTQLVVGMALADRVDAATVAAIVKRDEAALSADVKLGMDFARASLAHAPAADELREKIVAKWGQRALVSLGFAIVSARIYPTLKYALGPGRACQRIVVAGTPVTVTTAASSAS